MVPPSETTRLRLAFSALLPYLIEATQFNGDASLFLRNQQRLARLGRLGGNAQQQLNTPLLNFYRRTVGASGGDPRLVMGVFASLVIEPVEPDLPTSDGPEQSSAQLWPRLPGLPGRHTGPGLSFGSSIGKKISSS